MKKRNKSLASTTTIHHTVKKMVRNWESHPWYTIRKCFLLPAWLNSVPSDEDQNNEILILKDPNVLEMLTKFAERFPEFNSNFNKPFLDMPSQTLLHGDIHNGNHMYQEDNDGSVTVVALDFQHVGYGAAISDIMKLLVFSKSHTSLKEKFDLLKIYHQALILSGVSD